MLNPIANHLERYLDLLSTRQKVVSGNVANADTPGYKTQDINFQAEFERLLNQPATNEAPTPERIEVRTLATRNDGNNVSLDREMRLLAENSIRFQLASQLLRGQIRAVKSAIQEGKLS